MEPKLPAPNFQPEQPPVTYEHTEQMSAVPEVVAEKSSEQMERHAEASQSGATPVLPSPVVGVVPQPSQPTTTPVAPTSVSDTPLVAADEDLIEKEWVDRAKKIVEETKDDPYRREQEVGKLQADYLRKRYGKELGASR